MRLTAMDISPIRCHTHHGLGAYHRASEPWDGVLVRLHTDADIIGLGEAGAHIQDLGDTAPHIVEMLRRFWPDLRGKDPFAIGELHRWMETPFQGYRAAQTAVDMALYDIMGKSLDQPVYRLLGGGYRDDIAMLGHVGADFASEVGEQLPIFAGIGVPAIPRESEDIRSEAIVQAERYAEQGYRGLEVKIGGHPRTRSAIRQRIDFAERVFESVGEDVQLTLDINQAWRNPMTVINAFRGETFSGAQNVAIEQPVEEHDYDGLGRIRTALNIPVVADESASSPEALLDIAAEGVADYVTLKPHRLGGVYPSLRFIAIAEAAGLGVKVDLSPFTKLHDTVNAHLATQLEHGYPAAVDGHRWFVERPFEDTGITYEQGRAIIPDAPGWGVDPDPDEIESLQYEPTLELS